MCLGRANFPGKQREEGKYTPDWSIKLLFDEDDPPIGSALWTGVRDGFASVDRTMSQQPVGHGGARRRAAQRKNGHCVVCKAWWVACGVTPNGVAFTSHVMARPSGAHGRQNRGAGS